MDAPGDQGSERVNHNNHSSDPAMDDEAKTHGGQESAKQVEGDRPGAANGHSQHFLPPSVPPVKRAWTTPPSASLLSVSSSAASSTKPSREPSPIRLSFKPVSAAPSRGSRSRKNSQELSPTRAPASNIPTVPSAAAIQRALSAVGAPQLPLPSQVHSDVGDPTRTPRPSKPVSAGSSQLPLTVKRVKSPPPAGAAGAHKAPIYSSRKIDRAASTPSIVLERSTPSTAGRVEGVDEGQEDHLVPVGMRTPLRGVSGTGPTLETVQEGSLPGTPSHGYGRGPLGGSAVDDRPETIAEKPRGDSLSRGAGARQESGSESGGTMGPTAPKESMEPRKAGLASHSAKPQVVHPKKSFTQLLPAKGKTGSEGMVKNMKVETETVSTIPHVSLGGGAGERTGLGRVETAGSLRLQPSTETIRPRKEKKRVTRKAPSLNMGTGGSLSRRFHHHHLHTRPPSPASTISLSATSPQFSPRYVPNHQSSKRALQSVTRKQNYPPRAAGGDDRRDAEGMPRPANAALTGFRGRTASSKADIFEAKVASAVDEVETTDSEETFVYESNPPEPLSARPHRYHSRTPSATSTVSQMDQYGPKGRPDGHHSIAGKKSMKFTNNPYHAAGYPGEPPDGTIRGTAHGGRASVSHASQHHHAGRFGRGGAVHPSLFDTDSPFPPAPRSLRTAPAQAARFSPRTAHPRNPPLPRVSGNTKQSGEPMTYDLEGEGADDERTPLVSAARSGRSRHSRRGVFRHGPSADVGRSPCCRRATALVSLGSLFTLLVSGMIVILLMCSKALYAVQVREIRNVLASEDEIMLDLHVQAVNPNLIAVQVNDLDVNIFAKSKHVGTNALWRNRHDMMSQPVGPAMTASGGDSMAADLERSGSERENKAGKNVDEGTDPIDDPEVDSQTMLLGRIFQFDSPLVFDASPIRHHLFSSMGGLRLAQPGNKSEEGGTRRWEKVMQYDFELIIRGVLRYSTPITSRPHSASISGSVIVHPGDGDGNGDGKSASMASSLSSDPSRPRSTVERGRRGGISAPFTP